MESLLRLLAVIAVTTLLSCTNVVAPTHMRPAPDAPSDVPRDATLTDEYRIGVGDTLFVSVWRNPDLTTQAIVLPDGNITVPLAGTLRAAGATTTELAKTIATTLGRFVREPQITIAVTNPASSEYVQRVRITGSVNAPQSVAYRPGLTVLDLVLLAGGVAPFAVPNEARLYRNSAEGLRIYPVRLQDIMEKGRLGTNYQLLPEDILTVPEKAF